MKKHFLLCCCLALATLAWSQKSPVKFGDIPMDDMTMKAYEHDTSAVAVVLVDYGEATLEDRVNSFVMKVKKHVRIKVFKNEGLSYADVIIPLYNNGSSHERVNGLKAATYNLENGKIVASPLEKTSIFKENVDKNWDNQKLTMPNVKLGSIIEYSYFIDSEFWTVIPSWTFQFEKIPVRRSEFWAITPTIISFEKYMTGYLSPAYEKKSIQSGQETSNGDHWIIENSPAFIEEPYMTSPKDYISRVNFAISGYTGAHGYVELMGSWTKLVQNLNASENFGTVISKSGFLKSKVEEITAGITDPMKKVEAIHTWVKQNIEWNGGLDYTTLGLRKIMETKKGDSGDINLLLASMLDKADIPVQMVMMSTRAHGFVRKPFPLTRQFNYVICSATVNDKKIFLDATSKILPVTTLPDRCMNGNALVVTADASEQWVDVSTKVRAKTITNGDFAMSSAGELTGKFSLARDGYAAYEMRKEYLSKGEAGYVKDFCKDHPWKVSKTEFSSVDVFEKPVKEEHHVSIEEHASVAGDVIYINPFVDSRIDDNPFKSETRLYPVDFGYPQEETYLCKIALPEGYVLDELPKSKIMMLPENAARFTFNATQIGNTVNIASSVQINKTLFIQSEYPLLREFYAQVIAKQNEQIVVRKKN